MKLALDPTLFKPWQGGVPLLELARLRCGTARNRPHLFAGGRMEHATCDQQDSAPSEPPSRRRVERRRRPGVLDSQRHGSISSEFRCPGTLEPRGTPGVATLARHPCLIGGDGGGRLDMGD